MGYRLIAADLDWTLLQSDGTLSPVYSGYNKAVHESRCWFYLCNRAYVLLCAALCPATAAYSCPLITYQGALLKDVSGNVMHALHLSREIAQSVEEILRKSDLHYNIYADETMYFSTFAPRFLDYARHIGVKPVAVPKALGDIAVTQFGVFADPEPIAQLQQLIQQQFGDDLHTVVTNGRFLEICHPMACKSYGLDQLTRHLGIDPSDVVAIGDNHNDLDMLRYAGLGVAVENAIPAAKAAGGSIDRF